MAIRIVRLGTPREPEEGLRIGTVRRPPRGVRKADYARRELLRCVAAGVGSKRAACLVGPFRTLHFSTLGYLCAKISPRNAPASGTAAIITVG